MTEHITSGWAAAWSHTPGPQALEWALLLAVAALAGHWVQRYTHLPKIIGYAVVGAIAGWAGLAGSAWPLGGVSLFLLELAIAIVLFEAGARLSLRWLRHNPMLVVQSLAESVATYAVAFLTLRALGLELPVVRALSVLAVASAPAVLMRVASDLRADGPITDRSIALATLNTLYALTLGTAMLRSIGRADSSMLASVGLSLAVLGISLVLGGALALLLAGAFRILRATSQDTAVVMLALVGACTAVAGPLGGSAPLAALLGGLLLKHMYPRPWVWPRQLGTAAYMLTIVMFVLVSSTAAQADWQVALIWAVLALIVVRALAKVGALVAMSWGSGLSPRKSFWVGVTMVPMSSVALLLTSQFASAAPAIGEKVSAVALPVILMTELVGAVLVSLALTHTGEAAKSGAEPPPNEAAPELPPETTQGPPP